MMTMIMMILMMIMMIMMIQVTDVNDRRLMRSLLLRVYNDQVANTPGCSLSECGKIYYFVTPSCVDFLCLDKFLLCVAL